MSYEKSPSPLSPSRKVVKALARLTLETAKTFNYLYYDYFLPLSGVPGDYPKDSSSVTTNSEGVASDHLSQFLSSSDKQDLYSLERTEYPTLADLSYRAYACPEEPLTWKDRQHLRMLRQPSFNIECLIGEVHSSE